jgi:APA family basic amino acid/polyamine antiporter
MTGAGVHLERNHLPLWKVAALAVAYVQLGPSAALSAGGIIPFSGSAAWLSTLLSVIAMAMLAVVIAAFARRWVMTGSLVSYAHEAFGSRARSLVAACLMLGYIALAAAMVAEVVVFTSSALIDLGFPSAASLGAQSGAAILISMVAAACAWRGIDVSVRVVVILGSLCLPFVVVTMAGAFMELHAKMLPQLALTGVSLKQIVQGAIAATGYYVGFDGISALASETRDPTRNIPRVLMGTIIFFGAVTTLSCLVQYPVLAAHSGELSAGASPVAIFANVMGVHWLAVAVDVLLVPATVAGTVALYNLGARIVATTAADGLLPRSLSRIHPRFHSPYIAVAALAIVGALAPIVLQAALHTSPLLSSVYLANLATYYWIAPYFITCAGILRVMRRERVRSPTTAAAAWMSMAAIVYVTVELFRSPIDAGTTYLPYLAVGTIAVMAAVLAITAARRKRVAREVEQVVQDTRQSNSSATYGRQCKPTSRRRSG